MRKSIKTALVSFMLFSGFLAVAFDSHAQYTNWAYRRQVTIQENSGSALSNFQVLLRVNTQTLINQGKMNPDGSDLRFASDCYGASPLAFYIERWLNTDSTEIWVRMPSLPANSSTIIYMFYGNTSATQQSSFNATFPNAYILQPFDFDVLGGNVSYDWFEIKPGSNLYLFDGMMLEVNARKIILDGTVNGDGTGYPGGTAGNAGQGPGGGGPSLGTGAGGGGYGADGGEGGYDFAAPINGGLANGTTNGFTIDMGSGGGGSNAVEGGNGGGAVAFIGKVLDIGGVVSLNGNNGFCCDNGSGGGAGGGAFFAGDYVSWNGFITAEGGNGGYGGFSGGDDDGGGGGAGGRVKFFYDTQGIFLWGASVAAGNRGYSGGGGTQDGSDGNDGTVSANTFTSPEPTSIIGAEVLKPLAGFTSTAPKCQGDTLSFNNTGSSGMNYYWDFGSGASPATSTLENPSGVSYSTPGTKTITFIVDDGTCSDTMVQTITIYETPTASFTSTAPVCAEELIDFTNTGSSGNGLTFYWDFGSGAYPSSSTAENPTGIFYFSGGTKTVTLTVTKGNCSATTSANITINNKPTADFASTAPGCTGTDIDFTNTGSTGLTYSWDFGSGATPATSTNENPTGIVYATAGTKSVTMIVTNGNCSDTIVQTINIYASPLASFTSTAPACAGSPLSFTNTGSSGGQWSYLWDFGAGATPAGSSAENPASVTYATGGNKLVTFTVSDAHCSTTDTATVQIYNLPTADAGPDTTICANRSVQIGSSSVGGMTYSWFPQSTLDDPFISNPTASPIAQTTLYIVTVTETATACQNVDSVVVTMLDPLLADAGADVEVCRGDSVQVGTGLLEGQSYLWMPATGLSDTAAANPTARPDSSTLYTVFVFGAGCDTVTDNVLVTVHQLPQADAGPDDTITTGGSTQLIASGGVQYQWSPAAGLSNSGIYNPIASPDTSTTYVVLVTDVYGCSNSDTLRIEVLKPSVWLPTAFTPDGNGKNDVLYVRGEGFTDFEFRIFNRWGEAIFLSRSADVGWDGNHQITGKPLPEGAYVYVVKGNLTDGSQVNLKGLINLIR